MTFNGLRPLLSRRRSINSPSLEDQLRALNLDISRKLLSILSQLPKMTSTLPGLRPVSINQPVFDHVPPGE